MMFKVMFLFVLCLTIYASFIVRVLRLQYEIALSISYLSENNYLRLIFESMVGLNSTVGVWIIKVIYELLYKFRLFYASGLWTFNRYLFHNIKMCYPSLNSPKITIMSWCFESTIKLNSTVGEQKMKVIYEVSVKFHLYYV